VSRKILREHGGDIRATSREGAGSTFTLEFPARFAGAEPATAAAAATLAPTDGGAS
jgi:signal transduction histidine kinase